MKESTLAQQSIELAVCAVAYYKCLYREKHEYILSRQFLRSATSIGANIHEAYYAVSRADFISKMHIALKESAETEYWLTILARTGYSDERFSDVERLNLSVKKMLISTLNTSRRNQTKQQANEL